MSRNPKPRKNVENLLLAHARALQLAPGDTGLACVGDHLDQLGAARGGGGAANLVNPHDVEDIAKAIARCIVSPEHRAALAEKGVVRSADFDWRATAERTLEVYREAMGDGDS